MAGIDGKGLSDHPLYGLWYEMHRRCKVPEDSAFRFYGAQGVTVCKEWNSLARFINDMGSRPSPKHSIDRIDGSKPYCKENCRWATQAEQVQNSGVVTLLTWNDATLPIGEWEKRLGLPPRLLSQRLNKLGWDLQRAMTTPARKHAGRKQESALSKSNNRLL